MNDFVFDIDAYLQRIGLSDTISLDAQGLEQITRAQGFTIPFENFDIMLGRGIDLAPNAVFEKLVLSPRGGYCFELNGLLLAALQHLGFAARPLLARVHLRGEPTGRTHQLLLIKIRDREWLADVGFGGGGLLAPIPFDLNQVFTQDDLDFRLVRSEQFDYMLQLRKEDFWQDLYSFDLTHVGVADIMLGNHFTSTHSECFFTFSRVATIPVKGGRISLKDFTLRKSIAGTEEIIELPPGQPYLEALKTCFNIDLGVPYSALIPLPN